jgi:peroxiredoxin
MIAVGEQAPEFALKDHLGRELRLTDFRDRSHVLLLFYPLDWTPTWSTEVPQTEALLARFRAAHTQVLGVSVDSTFSHASWGASLGGVSFPLLSDFHPKGAVAQSLGVYLDGAGITDRASLIIDSSGAVQYAVAVGPGGQRDIEELAAECERIDALGTPTADAPSGAPVSGVLYVRNQCGPSRFVQEARTNLHLEGLQVRNVSDDSSAAAELEKASGGSQAPVLVVGDEATAESAAIIAKLVAASSPL